MRDPIDLLGVYFTAGLFGWLLGTTASAWGATAWLVCLLCALAVFVRDLEHAAIRRRLAAAEDEYLRAARQSTCTTDWRCMASEVSDRVIRDVDGLV